jgi:hypothetical protein
MAALNDKPPTQILGLAEMASPLSAGLMYGESTNLCCTTSFSSIGVAYDQFPIAVALSAKDLDRFVAYRNSLS